MRLAWIKFSEARSEAALLLAQLHLHTWTHCESEDNMSHCESEDNMSQRESEANISASDL